MKRIFACLILTMTLAACGRIANMSKTQIVHIDSNVTADVYMGSERLGQTPFYGEIPRGLTTSLRLEAKGYRTAKVPLKPVARRDAVHSTKLEESSMYLTYNVTFLWPFFSDVTVFASGQWVEYMPNVFYVELIPESLKKVSVEDMRNSVIRAFALVNYPDIVLGKPEHTGVLASLASLPDATVYEKAVASGGAVLFVKSLFPNSPQD